MSDLTSPAAYVTSTAQQQFHNYYQQQHRAGQHFHHRRDTSEISEHREGKSECSYPMSCEEGGGISTCEKVNTMTSFLGNSSSPCEPLKPANPYKREKRE